MAEKQALSFDKQNIADVEKLIGNNKPEEALAFLKKFTPADANEQRILAHLTGQAYVHAGELEKAKNYYQKALDTGSSYIGVWCDLACCHYLLGEIEEWQNTYKVTKQILDQQNLLLSSQTKHRTQIVLSKFLEEEGHIAQSLELLENCQKELKPDKANKDLYYRCLPQIIRIKSLFAGHSDELGKYYTQLISLGDKDILRDLRFEIEHSLMLAELVLIGIDHAWLRVANVLNQNNIAEIDKRLIFYDFLEETLLKNEDLPPGVYKQQNHFQQRDNFEQEIHTLTFYPEAQRDLLSLSYLAPELSLSSYLRLLILYWSKEKNPIQRGELRNKIDLILSSLEPAARRYWIRRMQPFSASTTLSLEYCPKRRSLNFQQKELDLSRKKGMLVLVQALAEKSQYNVEELIKRLWSSPYSPEHFHRLRMTAHRLNRLLFDLTAVPKIVEVNSETVKLNPSVNLSRAQQSH